MLKATMAGGGAKTWLDEVQADSPMGLWLMQETSGTTLAATTGNNGTYSASDITYAATGPGKLALPKAAQFGGASSGASTAINLGSLTAATACFWLYWDSYAAINLIALQYTTNVDISNGFAYIPQGGSVVGNGAFGLMHKTSPSGYKGRYGTRPSLSAWHHIALVMDRVASVCDLYVNGVNLATDFTSGWTPGSNFANANLYLMYNSTAARGAGRMCGLSIHPTALSAVRIAAHFAGV